VLISTINSKNNSAGHDFRVFIQIPNHWRSQKRGGEGRGLRGLGPRRMRKIISKLAL